MTIDFTHHAYLIVGDTEGTLDALFAELETSHNISWRGNPDVWREDVETFGIDDARRLAEVQTRKAIEKQKILIVAFQSITHEAQNALLKVFEEPTANTHFFIITPSDATLLPTLRSRLTPLRVTNNQQLTTNNKAKEFLTGDTPTRLEIVQSLVEEKNKAEAIKLLDALEQELHERGDWTTGDTETTFALREILNMRGYLRDRAPSVKMILEHLVLVVPQL